MTDRWTASSTPPAYAPQAAQGPGMAMILVLSFLVALIAAAGLHLVLDRTRGNDPAPFVSGAAGSARVVVPDLVGLTAAGARTRAELDGFLLHLAVRGELGSVPLERGVIAAQRPLPGSLIRTDDVVEAFLDGAVAAVPPAARLTPPGEVAPPAPSKDVASRAVPDVTGLSVTDASRVIRGAGLRVGELMEVVSLDQEPGVVLSHTPVAGATVPEGAAITLAVATAPAGIKVPHVGRVNADTARARITAVGLRPRVDAVFSPTVPSGLVIQLKPPPGTEVAPNSVVNIFIAE